METIMDDEVTERFSAEERESWNLLSRTNYNLHSISLRLTVLWGLGVLIRYCFLLPLRIALAFTGISLLVVGTTVVGYLLNGRFKEFVSKHVHSMCHRICVRALTAIITYHDRENRPRNGGICVANHTSPIDVIILASDGYYTMWKCGGDQSCDSSPHQSPERFPGPGRCFLSIRSLRNAGRMVLHEPGGTAIVCSKR
uniref:glycerol-3-phosphate acyltransferase 4 isoform X1 n=1 Tax=Callithrix jacchus TaxID=9483 RepID=UPI0023DCFBC9|nr:glycerol-3-phosphate acyltransferase 4 isoform X1 [Callithrix jacchus]